MRPATRPRVVYHAYQNRSATPSQRGRRMVRRGGGHNTGRERKAYRSTVRRNLHQCLSNEPRKSYHPLRRAVAKREPMFVILEAQERKLELHNGRCFRNTRIGEITEKKGPTTVWNIEITSCSVNNPLGVSFVFNVIPH
jgi:hypothetical protein